MATISSLGTGSGLDLEGLITKLMQVEQLPLNELATKEAKTQAKISALGSLKSALSGLQGSASAMTPATGQTATEKFFSYTASIADTTVASASAATGAVAGTYSLEVTAVAAPHRLVTPANTYASSTTTIATGTLSLDLGSVSGGEFTAESSTSIVIDSTNNTLAGLRDAINHADAGVTATIVTGTTGARLTLTSDSPGTSSVMRLSGLTGFDFNPVTETGTLSQATADGGQAAASASLKINGISITSNSNTVTDALDGVTINLLKTNTGTPTTLTVTQNKTATLTSTLNAFVKAFNEVAGTARELGSYDAEAKKAQVLSGDATLRLTQNRLRALVFSTPTGITGDYTRLSNIGISLQKDGTLALDSTKLQAAINASPDDVASLVAGFGDSLTTTLDDLIGTDGVIAAGTDGLNRRIADIHKQGDRLSLRLTQIEARYRAQFSALDSLVASMNSTSSYLQQQLQSIASLNRNGNS